MNIKKEELYIKIQNTMAEVICIIFGSAIMAIGVSLFLLPNQLSSGGFAGVATITYYLFSWQMGGVILALNIPLFLLAFLKLGKRFFAKALLGTILLSVWIDYFDKFQPFTTDRFLACIYGGIIVGIGTAIILKAEASTGGSELLANIINHYNRTFRTSSLIIVLDIIIVTLNVIVFKQLDIGMYSAIAIYIMGKVLDIVFEGVNFTKTVFIISDKYEEIAKKIGDNIQRGSTGIYAKGMYTNKEKMMLFCVGSRSEVVKIRQIANKIDKGAFIVISNAREAFGQGFKRE